MKLYKKIIFILIFFLIIPSVYAQINETTTTTPTTTSTTTTGPHTTTTTSTIPPKKTCEDSDGGINYYINGTVTVCTYYEQGGSCSAAVDFCDGDILTEGFCEGNDLETIKYTCRDSGPDCTCFDGKCGVKGDLNGDGEVNIVDIVIIAKAFGSKEGDPNWNPDADLDNDGDIDILDVVKAVINFGKECPSPEGQLGVSGPIFAAVIAVVALGIILVVFKLFVKKL